MSFGPAGRDRFRGQWLVMRSAQYLRRGLAGTLVSEIFASWLLSCNTADSVAFGIRFGAFIRWIFSALEPTGTADVFVRQEAAICVPISYCKKRYTNETSMHGTQPKLHGMFHNSRVRKLLRISGLGRQSELGTPLPPPPASAK